MTSFGQFSISMSGATPSFSTAQRLSRPSCTLTHPPTRAALTLQLQHRGQRINRADNARRVAPALGIFGQQNASDSEGLRLSIARSHFPFATQHKEHRAP